MASRNLELVLKIRADNSSELNKTLAAIKGVNVEVRDGSGAVAQYEANFRALGGAMQSTSGSAAGFSREVSSANESMAAGVVKGQLLVEVIRKVGEALKAATIDAAQYAARTETLGIVNTQLAKVNGLNVQAVRGVVSAVKDLGITTQEAYNTVNQMIFAQLDLAKATDIARMAQDAAVIAGKNSSETLQGIIHGIRSQQVEVLRTYGINVNFEAAFTKAQRELKRDLTATEKQTIALNEVLKQAPKIAGTYEAAIDSVGKKMTSLQRYVDEAKNSIGKEFQSALGTQIEFLTESAKWVQENARLLAELTKAIGLAAGAFALFKLGAVISGMIEAAAAAGGLAAAFRGLSVAIASNPVGLALVAISTIIGITISQLNDLKKGMSEAFDLDDANAKKLEETLKRIADEMRDGKKTADDFKQAIREALDAASGEGQKKELLTGEVGGLNLKRKASFQDFEFRDFVRNRFKQDPEVIEQMVKDGNKAGIAMAKAMQAAFEKEFNPVIDTEKMFGFKLKIQKPKSPEEIEAERLKAQKAAEEAQKQVTELARQEYVKGFDGLQKLNAEREIAIQKLGKTAGLIAQINDIFDKAAASERKELMEKALGLQPMTLQNLKTAAELTAAIQKAALDTSKRTTLKIAQEIDPETFGDKKIKYGAEAFEKQTKLFETQLKRAIEKDEEFLREAKKVIDAFREVEEAQAGAAIEAARAQAGRAERLMTLTAAPGSEASVAVQVSTLKRNLAQTEYKEQMRAAAARRDALLTEAKTEYDKTAANLKYRADAIKAEGSLREKLLDLEQERTEKILELRKQQLEDFKQTAGSVFDALTAKGGGGLKDFVEGYVKSIEKTLFVNASAELFRASRDKFKMALPGQTDGKGNLNVLGRILQGTPFGVDPAKLAQDANTNATKDNTLATRQLTIALAAARSAAAGGTGSPLDLGSLGGLVSDGNGITGQGGLGGSLGGLFGGGTSGKSGSGSRVGSALGNLFSGISSAVTGGLFSGFKKGDWSVQLGDGKATTASSLGLTSTAGRIGNVVGSVGALAGAGYGIYSGIQRGGAGGILQAVGSGLGAAAMIPGPQQPFLQAGAMLVSLFSGLFGGDKRAKRDKEIEDTLNSNKADYPKGSDRVTDLLGNDYDYDYRGNGRVVTIVKTTVNVDTMDSRSFLDNSGKIAEAFSKELLGGNEPLRNSVQAAAFA